MNYAIDKNKTEAHKEPVYLVAFLIVIYIMLYEWGLFEASFLAAPVAAAKIIIPVLLLVFIRFGKIQSKAFFLFVSFYLLFMLWGLVPGLFSGDFQVTGVAWLKLAARLLFAVLIGLYFLRQPKASLITMKLLVLVAVLSVLQFLISIPALSFYGAEEFFIGGTRGVYYGSYGLLGNHSAMMWFPGLDFPILRLTGFWIEPTHASGFMFAAFFLARIVYHIEKKRNWQRASYVCLAGGFLCLSNAGYLAIAVPTLFFCLLMKRSRQKIIYVGVLGVLALGLTYFALQGRVLATEQYRGSAALSALSGAREGFAGDQFGGRVQIVQYNLELTLSQPFGMGIRTAGEGGEGSFELASASAPVLWLLYTGFIGLLLLMLREYQIVRVLMAYSRETYLAMGAAQAWLAMFTQHLSYGTWMSPMYLFLCVLVFALVFQYQKTLEVGTVKSTLSPGMTPEVNRFAIRTG